MVLGCIWKLPTHPDSGPFCGAPRHFSLKYVSIPAKKCLAQRKNPSLPVTSWVFRYTLGTDFVLFGIFQKNRCISTNFASIFYILCWLQALPAVSSKRQVFRQWRVVSESGQHRVSHESSKGARWSRAIQQSGAAPQSVSSFADRPRHCRSQEHVQATDCNKKTTDQNQQPAYCCKTGSNLRKLSIGDWLNAW